MTDIGLRPEPVNMEWYEYIRMSVKERWAAVMPSGVPFARREYVTVKDLGDILFIMSSRQKIHDEVVNWFGSYYGKLRVIDVSNLSTNVCGIPSHMSVNNFPFRIWC